VPVSRGIALALAASLALGCSANDDIPAPRIASIVPDHGAAGSVVTVNGAYFCQRPDTGIEDPTCDVTGTVHFGTAPGTPSTWSDNAIMVEVPLGGVGPEQVTVTAVGRTSNSVSFTAE
jgi:hypothetical protein